MSNTIYEQRFLRSALFNQHGFHGIFGTRCSGTSPAPWHSLNSAYDIGDSNANVQHNIQQLTTAAHIASIPHQATQVHGITQHWYHGNGTYHAHEADILLTDQPGCAVAVRTADCLPVLLADPITGNCAAVHAGWKGVAASIACHAITAMQTRGSHRPNILVSLGPCIEACCFAVGSDVAQKLYATTPNLPIPNAQHADLKAIQRHQLQQVGIADANIEVIHACTYCDSARFFSHRREHGNTGRQLSIVAKA